MRFVSFLSFRDYSIIARKLIAQEVAREVKTHPHRQRRSLNIPSEVVGAHGRSYASDSEEKAAQLEGIDDDQESVMEALPAIAVAGNEAERVSARFQGRLSSASTTAARCTAERRCSRKKTY